MHIILLCSILLWSFCVWLSLSVQNLTKIWWRHQMETFPALLALCAGNSPVIGEFPTEGPVTRNFDVFFDLRLNKRLSKQSQAGDLRRHQTLKSEVCNNMIPNIVSILSVSLSTQKKLNDRLVSEIEIPKLKAVIVSESSLLSWMHLDKFR